VKMTALQDLHRNMRTLGVEIQQFRATTGSASFDCLFSVREDPFILALTSRGAKPKFFKFEVLRPMYWIKPYFEDFYYELAEVLKSGANTGEKLIPARFLEQLNNSIPTKANIKNVPKPPEIVRLRRDITEDRDKPYFDTWVYWESENRPNGSSPENRQKTLLILGKEALEHSIKWKASTRWSPIDLGRDWEQVRRR
jgi:hypothetical protein